MRDGVVVVHHDVVDDLLGLLHGVALAREDDLVLLAGGRVLRRVGDVDGDAELVLDLPDHGSALADDFREVRGVHGDEVLGEVVVLQGGVALFDELLHRDLRLGDALGLASDGEDVAGGVDARARLLLDELDLGALGPDDDAYLRLGHLHRRRRSVALLLLLCSHGGGRRGLGGGGRLGGDLLRRGRDGLRNGRRNGCLLQVCCSRHAGDVVLRLPRLDAGRLRLDLLLLHAVLPLLLLLREAGGDLPLRTGAVVHLRELLRAGRPLLRLLLLGLRRGLCLGLRRLLRLALGLGGRLRCCLGGRHGLRRGLWLRLGLSLRFGLRFRLSLGLRLRLGLGGRSRSGLHRLGLGLGFGLRVLGLLDRGRGFVLRVLLRPFLGCSALGALGDCLGLRFFDHFARTSLGTAWGQL
mmetsp:Transcript_34180/g.69056  ORF Transcript_34180/g.69056 Transcript_34180/m.69056 type:complete len:410 (-) Transcript_34180:37-1266(-)